MQQWIDSYHTGYKVEALHDYANYCGDYDVLPNLRRAVHFYRKEFFSENGTPKFYPRSMYPIDIHASAQGIFTLVRACADLPLAKKVARWTIRHMQDQQGFFYYKKTRFYTIRVPYLRWSEAWMLYGLSWLLGDSGRWLSRARPVRETRSRGFEPGGNDGDARPRVVMLVSNGFHPDVRVHHEARSLVGNGYRVEV